MIRFANGHLSLDDTVFRSDPKPTSSKFTLVSFINPIGHVEIPRKVLVRGLKQFYFDLEYPSHYYALMTPGADPRVLREKVFFGRVKLHLLPDLLEKALWSKKHLIWFESKDLNANYRVRKNPLEKDTIKVIQRIMGCSE